jgi:DNA-binding transcriptional LysR family regulator
VTLTAAGEAFLAKARTALTAIEEAEHAARSLAQGATGAIEFGFLGIPPGLDSPKPLEVFARAHPDIELRFRELPFPVSPTTTWLAEVDVAVCHAPPEDPAVWSCVLRREPRVVLAPSRHPLAGSSELRVADVLEETFIGLDPSIEPAWAGFWSLDDHRGAPPAQLTPDRASSAQEVFAALALREAITTVPASVTQVLANVRSGVAAIPLRDADPATITLVGHEDSRNPRVAALRAFAMGDGAIAAVSGSPAAMRVDAPAA